MRHYFSPSSEKAQSKKRRTKLKTLPLHVIKLQLDDVEDQLKPENAIWLTEPVYKALLKRQKDLALRKLELELDEAYRAKLRLLRNPLGLDLMVDAMRREGENPNRKAVCKVPNGGFKRPKPPSPTGKTVGAFRVERPRKAADKLTSDRQRKTKNR